MNKETDEVIRLSELAELLPARMRQRRVLIVENEASWRNLLRRLLADHDWDVVEAEGVGRAREIAGRTWFDLMIVDRGLDDGDGLDFIAALRAAQILTPAIILTGMHSDDRDAIEDASGVGLNSGADDYMSKPFKDAVLIARVDAQMRRARREGCFSYWPFRIDGPGNHIELHGSKLDMPQRDASMLALLLADYPQPVAKWRFLDLVWKRYRGANGAYNVQHSTIDVAISILKRNLAAVGVPPDFICAAGAGQRAVSGRGADLDRAWRVNPDIFPSAFDRLHAPA